MMQSAWGSVRQAFAIVLLAGLWAFLVTSPHRQGEASLLDRLEAQLFDLRLLTFGPMDPTQDVVIVAIDDETLRTINPLGQGRQNLAALIDHLAAKGAAVVGVDILLTEAGDPDGDAVLSAAMRTVPTVVAAAGGEVSPVSALGMPETHRELWPQPPFVEASSVGIVNVSTSLTGTPVHVPMVFLTSRGVQPTFAAEAAALYLGQPIELSEAGLRLGDRVVALDQGYQMPFRVIGPARTVPTVSAKDVLDGAHDTLFEGKVVVIGITAAGLGDRFETPFDQNTPGVDIMAMAIGQVIEGHGLRREEWMTRVESWAAIPVAMIAVALTLSLPLIAGVGSAAILVVVWLGATWVLFPLGYWMNSAIPLVACGFAILPVAVLRYTRERRWAEHDARTALELGKFQSPAVADRIAENPGYLAQPERHEMVVCFVDLSGFTAMSQSLGPDRSEGFLRKFHTLLEKTVSECNGSIFNFMGDGALIVFGAFDETQRPADDALEAAIHIVRRTRQLGIDEGLNPPLRCRIGLHFGPVVLSRMGGERHQQLTVTGDSVNLASRLLEIAKEQSENIAATEDFTRILHDQPHLPVTRTDAFSVRGRKGTVTLSFWRP